MRCFKAWRGTYGLDTLISMEKYYNIIDRPDWGVMGGKEKLLSGGLALFTLRYASEIRPALPYFEDLADGPLEAAQLELAQKLIEAQSGP
jgi:hypothetical protein